LGASVMTRNWTFDVLASAATRLARSSTRSSTTRISVIAKLAPRHRRVPPPNGSHV
jgi:hypothetical protein